MAGKFTNTRYKDDISSLVSSLQSILKNPYYKWSNKSATLVNYYNRNKEKSTLDESTKLEQTPYGPNSPTIYNIINDFYLYGIEQIQIQIENGEFGAEAGQITGEAIVLPNTIIPYSGDYFVIQYTKDDIVFKVTGVSHDTLEDGANIYKISYELDSISIDDLKLNIGDHYQMMINNLGTGFNPIIRTEKYDFVKRLDGIRSYLKEHYTALFYSERIQSFSFMFNMRRFYDPYMVEFIKNNGILEDNESYVFVTQQLSLSSKFILDYDRSIFRCFEDHDFNNIRRYKHYAIGRYITSQTDIFSNRPEDYWKVDFNYLQMEGELYGVIPCFNEELFTGIEQGCYYDDEYAVYNIIIKYVRNENITNEDIDLLKFLEYIDNPMLFYSIPIILFCLDEIIKKMMIDVNYRV